MIDTLRFPLLLFAKVQFLVFLMAGLSACASAPAGSTGENTELYDLGISVIPYPQQVRLDGDGFRLDDQTRIVLDRAATESDRFAAEMLAEDLAEKLGIQADITTSSSSSNAIRLTRQSPSDDIEEQGYRLVASSGGIVIEAKDEPGLYYGTRTLVQLIRPDRSPATVPGVEILDWADIPERAIHYDTKHSQDKRSYVEKFIRELSHYKINMLIWEWEDKFEYPSHPHIGAPGAFTMEEMQELTRYAQKHHVQIVPLVQGLGHVSFILKWPQHAHLREHEASNWQFCALNDGAYELLFQLWEEAIEATPGSEYIHIGSDETYELGEGVECGCQAKAEEIGMSGLFHLFVGKSARHLQGKGRKVIAWERPMGWERHQSPIKGGAQHAEDLVLIDGNTWRTPSDFPYVRQARELGHEVFVYDPNPGIEPLFLPYFYKEPRGGAHVPPGTQEGEPRPGSLEHSYNTLVPAAQSGLADGMVRTSWDDAGLHNQKWMMQYLNAAEFSWSANAPSLEEFIETYPRNYYGPEAEDVIELYKLFNDGSYFYWDSLERKVWHYGTIGKTQLPDLPRGDALEYDPYWNARYDYFVERSREMNSKMDRALEIIEANKAKNLNNSYDFELFEAIAGLIQHTALLYLDLSEVEKAIEEAHQNRYISYQTSWEELDRAVTIVEELLERRHRMYDYLVEVWEKTTLPKGYSTEEKPFFHKQDRARHFAFRKPDMSFLIHDEEMLDIEGYLEDLKAYTDWYRATFIDRPIDGPIDPFFNIPGH